MTPMRRALLTGNQRQPAHQTKGANSAPFPAPTLVLEALLITCKNLHFLCPVKLARDGGQQSRRIKCVSLTQLAIHHPTGHG